MGPNHSIWQLELIDRVKAVDGGNIKDNIISSK